MSAFTRPSLFLVTLWLGLGGCGAEKGIDDTTVRGTVRIEPTVAREANDTANDGLGRAQDLGGLHYRTVVLTGDTSAGTTGKDNDHYRFVAEREIRRPVFQATWESNVAGRVDLLDEDGIILFGTSIPPEGGTLTWNRTLQAGSTYILQVTGDRGADPVPYEVVLPTLHPDGAGFLVGAYTGADPGARGDLAGGTDVGPFEEVAPYTWEASWEMFLLRTVVVETREGKPDKTTVDESLDQVYLYAGDWSNLAQALPAGTFHTSTPVAQALGRDDITVDTPLVLDAIAPLVIGQIFEEEEPNDVTVSINTFGFDAASEGDAANDAGVLSGTGFVDLFRGHMEILSADEDWTHDQDAWRFAVPEPGTLTLTVDWEDDKADLDAILTDGNGDPVDWAASFDKPDVGGGTFVFEPEQTYFLVALGYVGQPGSSVPYEIRAEFAPAR